MLSASASSELKHGAVPAGSVRDVLRWAGLVGSSSREGGRGGSRVASDLAGCCVAGCGRDAAHWSGVSGSGSGKTGEGGCYC